MGTRSLTFVYDTNFSDRPKALCCIYRQMDGYPRGMGKDLADFAAKVTIVNGISLDGPEQIANGGGCFAAQLVAHLKTGPGGIYLHETGEKQDANQEYEYRLYVKAGEKVRMKVKGVYKKKTVFDDTVDKFDDFLAKSEEGLQ